MRRVDIAEPLLEAAHHYLADHLAGDASGGGNPADRLTIMAIEGEGDAHHLAVPASEPQRVGAPAEVGADPRDLAVMLARTPTAGVAFEQEAVFLYQPISALCIDQGQPVGSPLALEERGDPTVAVGRALIDQATNVGAQFEIAWPVLWPAFCPGAVTTLDEVGPGYAQRLGDRLHGVSSGSGERDSNIGFFARAKVERFLEELRPPSSCGQAAAPARAPALQGDAPRRPPSPRRRPYGLLAAFAHQLPPAKYQAG
jgi:hypothetical protein